MALSPVRAQLAGGSTRVGPIDTHGHVHPEPRLLVALLLTAGVLAVEVTGGIAGHSLALLADAGHVLTDIGALLLAWLAYRLSGRPADHRRTYGYHRAGIVAAFANGLLLLGIAAWIAVEAARRLLAPSPVHGQVVVVAALVAVAVNAYIGWSLHGDSHDLNVRAAWVHVLGDLGAGVGVVVAGLLIIATGWTALDPLASLGITGLVAWGAVSVVRESVNVLLEGTPSGVDVAAVEAALLAGPGVQSVHDLHVWSLTSREIALSCHLVVDEGRVSEGEHLVREAERMLCDGFGIGHSTIQLETCHPCEPDPAHGPGTHNHPHRPLSV